MGGVCGARMGLCNGGSYSAREEERGGDGCSGFYAEAARQVV